jgi:hypothetical protein
MGIFDTENIYPNDDFWLENGFVNLRKPGIWIWCGPKLLHWNLSGAGTRWGNVNIRVIYNKYKKELEIAKSHTGLFGDYDNEVEFETIELHNPTQQEIKMALSQEYLSSRLTYKFN